MIRAEGRLGDLGSPAVEITRLLVFPLSGVQVRATGVRFPKTQAASPLRECFLWGRCHDRPDKKSFRGMRVGAYCHPEASSEWYRAKSSLVRLQACSRKERARQAFVSHGAGPSCCRLSVHTSRLGARGRATPRAAAACTTLVGSVLDRHVVPWLERASLRVCQHFLTRRRKNPRILPRGLS